MHTVTSVTRSTGRKSDIFHVGKHRKNYYYCKQIDSLSE